MRSEATSFVISITNTLASLAAPRYEGDGVDNGKISEIENIFWAGRGVRLIGDCYGCKKELRSVNVN